MEKLLYMHMVYCIHISHKYIVCLYMNMKIEITPEMLEAARRKRDAERALESDIVDPGSENICIACE